LTPDLTQIMDNTPKASPEKTDSFQNDTAPLDIRPELLPSLRIDVELAEKEVERLFELFGK